MNKMDGKKIYLASASPRRKEIMTLSGLAFTVISPLCDENIENCMPGDYCMELSLRKARAGMDLVRREFTPDAPCIVIGADTIVFHEETILGKPRNEQHAFEMLKALSGDTHEVYTGVTVLSQGGNDGPDGESVRSFYEKTRVTFFDIPDEELWEYIRTGEPADKAGAYGIQGRGCFLAEKIDGDFFNVMGLPVARLLRVMKEQI